MTSLELAELFHQTYEELAPSFGYETRKDTKKFDPDSANGKLMVAVCGHIIDSMLIDYDFIMRQRRTQLLQHYLDRDTENYE